jgi:glutamate N-acetyltransferase/amino-acid N-acetyltransferase
MKIRVGRPAIRVPGFRFAGAACGLKQRGKRDVALIVSDSPATAVGVFTTNRVKAAPVVIGQQRLRSGRVQAIVVNSGNANAYTGRLGDRAARQMTRAAAGALGIAEALVVPSSTGKIGVQLPMDKVERGITLASAALRPDAFHEALEGIMTTDAFPKFATARIAIGGTTVTVAGMAKGAGMIAPDMATMLAYVLTDARIERRALREIVRSGVGASFNAIVVDGDMSTNDTLLVLANGVARHASVGLRHPDFGRLRAGIHAVMHSLARLIVKDGEGATKLVDIQVRGARSSTDAERVADTIARSPLCKTAFYGGDPYAGRVVCAIGYSGARVDPARLDIAVNDVQLVRRGRAIDDAAETRAAAVVAQAEFTLHVDLRLGKASAYRMTSDLSTAYVRFNSDYRT